MDGHDPLRVRGMAAITQVATMSTHFAKVRQLAAAFTVAVCCFGLCLVALLIQTQPQNDHWPEAMSVLCK